jgi:hypothetical protein
VNNGQFRAAVSRVDSNGSIGTETIEGTLAGKLALALDFTRSFPNNSGQNDDAAQAFLALFQQFGGDSDALDLALATFTHSPKSNIGQEQLASQNDAAAQLQAAAAAVFAQARLLATALQRAMPGWVKSGLAGAFNQSDPTARGVETGPDSSSTMSDIFWESVGRGVLGLPGTVTDVLDLLDPFLSDEEETETANDETEGNDAGKDRPPADDGEKNTTKARARSPQTDEERRRAFLQKRDEDEVALYVPAAAFVGPEWLTKVEADADRTSADRTEQSAGQTSDARSAADVEKQQGQSDAEGESTAS